MACRSDRGQIAVETLSLVLLVMAGLIATYKVTDQYLSSREQIQIQSLEQELTGGAHSEAP